MSKHSLNSISLVAVLAAAVFVVAFAMLLFVGDYRIMASIFMALLIALLAGIVLYLGLGNPTQPVGTGARAGTGVEKAPGTSQAATAAAGAIATPAPETAEADAEAARKAAEEEAARKAAADAEAAQKAEAEAAARKAAEDEAARKAAEEEAAAKATADARAAEESRAAEETSAEAAVTAPPAPAAGEDYDGDGVHEGVNEGTRPAGLDAPRNGHADDLKQIKGVGPKLEKLCNTLGFWHFDQVAAWTAEEVAWVDANLMGFKGRVSRDEWVEQAKVLASGGETEFSKRVEGGDVY